jgi:hypothetical protein
MAVVSAVSAEVGTWLSMGSVVPIGVVGTIAAVVITRVEVTGGGTAVVVVAEEAMQQERNWILTSLIPDCWSLGCCGGSRNKRAKGEA